MTTSVSILAIIPTIFYAILLSYISLHYSGVKGGQLPWHFGFNKIHRSHPRALDGQLAPWSSRQHVD